MTDAHTYTLKVTFTRQISDDLDLLETLRRGDPLLNWRAAAIKQLTKELQAACDSGGLDGHFKVDDCDLLYGEDAEADEKVRKMYPMMTRWKEVADDARVILEFLDWAREGNGLQDVHAGDVSPKRLVYEFFEINGRELENERCRVIDALRESLMRVGAEKEG